MEDGSAFAEHNTSNAQPHTPYTQHKQRTAAHKQRIRASPRDTVLGSVSLNLAQQLKFRGPTDSVLVWLSHLARYRIFTAVQTWRWSLARQSVGPM